MWLCVPNACSHAPPSHAQLPPIPSRQPPAGAHGVPFLNRGHCFESEAWHSLQFVVKELKYVWRQENRHFVDVLQDIRYGRVTPRVRQFVGSCRRPLKMKKGVIPTKLFCKNRYVAVPTPSVQQRHATHCVLGGTGSHRQVDETNQNELTRIRQPCSKFPSKEGIYRDPEARVAVHVANRLVRPAAAWVCPVWGCVEADARCVSQLMQSDFWRSCLAPKFMSLKKGAQVMLLANLDASMGLVNGARGVVVGYAKAEDPAVQATTRFVGDELLLPKTACFSPADPTLCVQTELAHTQARPALGGCRVGAFTHITTGRPFMVLQIRPHGAVHLFRPPHACLPAQVFLGDQRCRHQLSHPGPPQAGVGVDGAQVPGHDARLRPSCARGRLCVWPSVRVVPLCARASIEGGCHGYNYSVCMCVCVHRVVLPWFIQLRGFESGA